MSVVFISRDDPRHAAIAAAADRQAEILCFAAGRALGGGKAQTPPTFRDAFLDHAGAILDTHGDATADRLSRSATALAFRPPLDAGADTPYLLDPPTASGFVVTVTLGPNTVLSVGGENALLSRLPPAEQRALVQALADALRLAAGTEPARSATHEAADLLDSLTAGLSPSDADASDAALALPVLARCQALIDAARARLAL